MTCCADRRDRVRSIFTTLRSEVIAGQYMDLRLAAPTAQDDQALRVALLKSGRYTVTRPLELGAALAGADAELISALRSYGDAIGVAFQLRDDVLGVFGSPDCTGKGASEDLRDGKASLLLVRAVELASPRDRGELLATLGSADADDAALDRCRKIVRRSGALASVEALIASKADQARRAVRHLPGPAAGHLLRLGELLVDRAA
jgi:geranylgeranyl diphosphate synthase type I